MGLIFRTSSLANAGATQVKNAALTYQEGDGNFAWLATNLSGSVISITGSVSLLGSFNLKSLTTAPQSNIVTVDTTTGRLYYTASSAIGASVNTGSLLITASATSNVLTFTKGDNSTFNVTVNTGSGLSVNTGSFMITGSVANNVLTFTKGDNSTFNLTVNTGSGTATDTGSLMKTGSISGNVLTFTKGDNTTFNLTVNTGSNVVTASGTTLYSIGLNAGGTSFSSDNSVLLGNAAGFNATNAKESVFLGYNAGREATSTSGAIFIGYEAGTRTADAEGSIFIGYRAGYTVLEGSPPGPNNITIGNYITVPAGARNAINIGGMFFATGALAGTPGAPFSTPIPGGKVGILNSNPQFTLDVSGSGRYTDTLIVTGSDSFPVRVTATGFLSGSQVVTRNDYATGYAGISADSRGDFVVKSATLGVADSGIRLETSNQTRVFISGSGDIGIGTLSPAHKLDVRGSVGVETVLQLTELNPLPTGVVGQLAVSESKLYFYDGSWRAVSLV